MAPAWSPAATRLTLTYGNLASGRNNDCSASGAPAGVIRLTIHGTQPDRWAVSPDWAAAASMR